MNSEHIEIEDYLRSLLAQGLLCVHGRHVVREHLAAHPAIMPDCIIAIGKAAGSMLEGVYDIYGTLPQSALVITRSGHAPESLRHRPGCEIMIGDHPVPDQGSLTAGNRLLRFIAELPPGQKVLCLISGGASALVEVLPSGVSIDDLRRTNQWLLASGWDIAQVNRVRKKLSMIKGGGLAGALNGHQVTALLLSDVPGDDPAVIGSGLLVPDRDHESLPSLPELPPWLASIVNAAPGSAPGTVPAAEVACHIVGNNSMLVGALARYAREDGYHVTVEHRLLSGDAQAAGTALAQSLKVAPAGIYLQGGETTVKLPASPGYGGRNTTLALAAALELAGWEDCYMLAAGSDGSDGVTSCAGAVVSGVTLRRGNVSGLEAAAFLARADAATCLERTRSLVTTGPTGTNVMDIVVGMRR